MSKNDRSRRRYGNRNENVNTNTATAHNETYVSQETNVVVSVENTIRERMRGKMRNKFCGDME